MLKNEDTYKSLAEYLGISSQSVSNKVNENGTEFNREEIKKITLRWKLSAERLMVIFFN